MGVEIKWRQGRRSKTQPFCPAAALAGLPTFLLFIPFIPPPSAEVTSQTPPPLGLIRELLGSRLEARRRRRQRRRQREVGELYLPRAGRA